MTKTIECTLQEAYEQAEKGDTIYYGGISFVKGCNHVEEPRMLPCQALDRGWLIKKKEKSAFQEWSDGSITIALQEEKRLKTLKRGRKEGWNGSLRTLLELFRQYNAEFGDFESYAYSTLEKLKEP